MGPKVSVIICVYNGGKIIGRCIDSLLNQDYDNYEIIVVNDGSTDNTDKILGKYKDRVIYAKNKINKGLAAARNRGTELAKGEYVAFTDVDCVVDKYWLT